MDARHFSKYTLSRGQICVQLALRNQRANESDTESDVSDDRDPEWLPPKKKQKTISDDSDTDSENSFAKLDLLCHERNSDMEDADNDKNLDEGKLAKTITHDYVSGQRVADCVNELPGIRLRTVDGKLPDQIFQEDVITEQTVEEDGVEKQTFLYCEFREEIVEEGDLSVRKADEDGAIGITVAEDGVREKQTVTGIAREQTVTGGAREQTVAGSAGEQTVTGGAREQTVAGSAREQTVTGNAREQTVTGGTREQTVTGGTREQTVAGNAREQTVTGGTREQTVAGNAIEQTVTGGTREQTVTGNAREQTVTGGTREQTVAGSARGQTVTGGAREQTVLGNAREHKDTLDDAGITEEDTISNNDDGMNETMMSSKKCVSKSQSAKNQLLRMTGKGYKGMKKTEKGTYEYSVSKEPKHLGPRTCSQKCRKNTQCEKLTEIERNEIFQLFWKMDWNQKKVFVANMVDSKIPEKRTTDKQQSRRKRTLEYHLKKDGIRIKVCKNMFLSTLRIGEWMMLSWTQSKQGTHETSVLTGTPNRAKEVDLRKSECVKDFIRSLPKLPSHYCRASTNRLYLQPDIQSLSELYRQYKVSCEETVSERTFRNILDEMNVHVSIFHPKKDQCDICCGHETKNLDDDVYQEHMKRKTEAREEKARDKESAVAGDCKVITMDLQAVLLAPNLKASAMYYKCKLACHNFTLYDLATGSVCCYFWHEGEGELTANTFASCIKDYICREIGNFSTLTIYSDGCTYQNRNVTMANTLLNTAMEKGITIFQKILEKGHTQMECDSVHSAIEKGMRNHPIYVPADYVEIMKNARLKQPYDVRYVDHTFFQDFTGIRLYNSVRPGTKVGDKCVTDLRVLRYCLDGTILYKTNYSEEEFKDFPRRAKASNGTTSDIPSLYSGPLTIKATKFKHLMELKSVIPRDYHGFYDGLKHD